MPPKIDFPMRSNRDGSPTRKNLFDQVSPGNVGNVFQIPASTPFLGPASYGQPVRVLDVSGEDSQGGSLYVSLQQESVIDTATPDGAPAGSLYPEGPLVGIAEFAAGAGIDYVEFDIPTPSIAPGEVQATLGTVPVGILRNIPVSRRVNGSLLALPASTLRVYARNDAASAWLGADPATDSALNLNNPKPATLRVHATYGPRVTQAHLTRTMPLLMAPLLTPTMTPGQDITFGIPPYARRVSFPRLSDTPATTMGILRILFTLTGYGTGGLAFVAGPYIVGATDVGDVEVPVGATSLTIINDSVGINIDNMLAVFELGI